MSKKTKLLSTIAVLMIIIIGVPALVWALNSGKINSQSIIKYTVTDIEGVFSYSVENVKKDIPNGVSPIPFEYGNVFTCSYDEGADEYKTTPAEENVTVDEDGSLILTIPDIKFSEEINEEYNLYFVFVNTGESDVKISATTSTEKKYFDERGISYGWLCNTATTNNADEPVLTIEGDGYEQNGFENETVSKVEKDEQAEKLLYNYIVMKFNMTLKNNSNNTDSDSFELNLQINLESASAK